MTDTDAAAGIPASAADAHLLQAYFPQDSVFPERLGKQGVALAPFNRLCAGWGGCLMFQSSLYLLTVKTLAPLKLHKQSYY